MRSLVIFYSQTGNTKKIAHGIHEGIKRESGQCDIIRFQDVTIEMLENYDLIGIGSPIWGSCPALNVITFIKKLPDSMRSKHFFFYCTHGVTPGRAIIRGVQPLLDRGMTVLGWRDWYGDASLPGHLKPWFTDGHPDEIDMVEARAFGTAMVIHSKKLSKGDSEVLPELISPEVCDAIYGKGHPFLFPEMEGELPMPDMGGPSPMPNSGDIEEQEPLRFPTSMAYIMELEGMSGIDINAISSKGRINAEKCIGCGRCVEACFCGNIDDSTTPVRFKNTACEHCYFCEGVCPTGAIEFDFRPPDDEPTQGLLDYMHILDRAEATGRFRRLVRDEDIGWHTPWELVTGHPRHQEIP